MYRRIGRGEPMDERGLGFTMKFSFVVLTWNRYKFLDISMTNLIASLAHPEQCEIIVMDNGSTDKTPEVLARYAGSPVVRSVTLPKNHGLNGYKKLFPLARGEYIVTVDDDVLEFPASLDRIFSEYMETFPDYGYLALNVVQDERTNGAKPGPECYTEETRNGKTIQEGPAGGWCSCFRNAQYKKLWLRVMLTTWDMSRPEDGFIANHLRKKFSLKHGLIKDAVCLHACGPYFAQQYGHLDREIVKYAASGLQSFVETYKGYQDKS